MTLSMSKVTPISNCLLSTICKCVKRGDFAVVLISLDRTHRLLNTMWRFLLLFSQIVLIIPARTSPVKKEPTCKNLDGYNVCQNKGVLVEVTRRHFENRLHINDMDLLAIREDAFKNVTVTHLNLNEGNRISVLTRGSFHGLPNLKRLDLDSNVVSLSEHLFAELPKLEALLLSFNKINAIPKDSFAGLSSLMWLYLSNNDIPAIEEESFSNLNPGLLYLWLNNNKISHVAPGAFAELTELNRLHLDDNQLQILPSGAFRGLNKLEFLYLDHNLITSVSRTLFSDLVSLKKLHFGHNKISSLEPGTFQDVSQLEDLPLNGNKLSHIKVGTFAGLSKLKYLILSDNNIHTVDNGAFSDLVELQSLDLTSNNITEIDKKISGLSSEVSVFLTP
ncbi:insulin-like growth factor-binding protein complex acid labile subunit [Linepithema humile]|uniref:insulin-like growth factor-binding protein complex acid labile subunit n=1 Tax=Linepithema humile TaxID=83485 RepID=UPI0006235CEA|nr:PREDICTED: insulin-like growth factor-binding protein complex acid labile subunit [Linepithema humile]